MRDQRHQTAVARQHRRRDERQARILHAPEHECGRQNEQVVTAPAIRAEQALTGLDHVFRFSKFPRGGLHDRRFGVDAGALADGAKFQLADRQRKQIRRDALRHREAVDVVGGQLGVIVGTHDGPQSGRRVNLGVVGDTDLRRILQRNPAAGVYRLGLRVQKRIGLAGGLRRRQPLQARCLGPRLVRNTHREAAIAVLRRQIDAQGLAKRADRFAQGELQDLLRPSVC